ncbi:conserved hypothetical protein [Hahella chejuensis KCTC 2396]|uniref:ATP-binding protein n=1 Tax=Hahella chejuensis (strain KCTC 2396) TaxID=349521 RepID=Q2S839_HAHCH|nr:AAA-like domain-containing protein [Hahella chejuensis]ABC33185.1 conserved hypothetical protein [Hahella chejuensis KCTC 2396]
MGNTVYPGKHKLLKYNHFLDVEKSIIEVVSKEFYVTHGGEKVQLGINSEYRYIIVSPTEIYKDMFNLDREIVVVFSPYERIQARTLDVFEHVVRRHSTLRIEKICNVLISKDENVESSLTDLIKSEPESQIIIPFSYEELKRVDDQYFFRNRFRKYFYSRDLFAFEAPLKKDIYFFGRNDLIQELVNRFKSGENSGLFGLRKTGKTSLVNGIERNLQREGIQSIIIDCQDTSFNQRRWNEALHYMCVRVKSILNLSTSLPRESEFNEKNASIFFEEFLISCRDIKKIPLFFIFDEIENISRDTASSEHWRNGIDFALFWQTLRSIFQRNDRLLSYLIVGTNPTCVELPKIDSIDNPIFNHFQPTYIPGFEVRDTREMVRKLGRRMGLKFNEAVFSRLTEDFGGHPFLMRHVCSLISKNVSDKERPVDIDRLAYKKGKDDFMTNCSNYIEMIIVVLKEFYPDEYDMLSMLANEDFESFNGFAEMHHSYTSHLIGYGIIRKNRLGYDFNIDAVKDYIVGKDKYQKLRLTVQEKWSEISERRNRAEVKLRNIVRMVLMVSFGENKAKEKVLEIFGNPRKDRLKGSKYREIFDPNKSEIYFSDISKIISKNWDVFNHVFSRTKKDVFSTLEFINSSRVDAHAKEITDDEFSYFRVCMKNVEDDIEGF